MKILLINFKRIIHSFKKLLTHLLVSKLFLISFYIMFISLYCFSDNTNDNNIEEEKIVKFRGSLSIPLVYYFPNDPFNVNNHISFIDYNYYYDFTEDGDEDYDHHDQDDPGGVITATPYMIESQIETSFSIIYPVLRGDHFLFKENNIKQKFIFSISPVSLKGGMSAILTPLPFLILEAGTTFGTGWNIPAIGINGLARDNHSGNDPDIAEETIESDIFFGPVMENWLKCILQFDFSPITPEKVQRWTHIIMQASFEFNNTLLLNYAYPDRPYYWVTSRTLNGWEYNYSFVIGYQIPVIIDKRKEEAEKKQWMGAVRHNNFSIMMVFMTEIGVDLTHYNYSKMVNKGWGSDFISCNFGPAIIFDLPNNLGLFLAAQWTNNIKYSSDTIGNEDFMKCEYEDWYLNFYRIILSFEWDF